MAKATEPFILIVEDDPGHALLIQAAFKKSLSHAKTHLVFNGWEAQAYLARQSPYHDWERCPPPSLVLLDLGLPDITGIEILEWMAEWDWLANIPVIVFTASEDPEDERRAYELGVRRYMRKPGDYGVLAEAVREELGTPMVVTSSVTQEPEVLPAERRNGKRFTRLALMSLSVLEVTGIVAAYEVMRYASTTRAVPVPLYLMIPFFIGISSLMIVYLAEGLQRQRRAAEIEDEGLVKALQRSMTEVHTLSGLLPICARCRKVKNAEGYWQEIDAYIGNRSEAGFRHGLCEVCVNAFLPEDADHAG